MTTEPETQELSSEDLGEVVGGAAPNVSEIVVTKDLDTSYPLGRNIVSV